MIYIPFFTVILIDKRDGKRDGKRENKRENSIRIVYEYIPRAHRLERERERETNEKRQAATTERKRGKHTEYRQAHA